MARIHACGDCAPYGHHFGVCKARHRNRKPRGLTPRRFTDGKEYNLTADQRTALELAYNRGYFESPRGATQEDPGDELDITRQAVSSLLQRGIDQLIASTLATDQSPRVG